MRTVANETISYYAVRIAQEQALSTSIQGELNTCDSSKLATTLILQETQELVADQTITIGKQAKKIRRLKPWATIAKVEVFILASGVIIYVTNGIWSWIPDTLFLR